MASFEQNISTFSVPMAVQVTCAASSALACLVSLCGLSSHYEAENTNLNLSLTCELPPQHGAQSGAPAVCDDNRTSPAINTKYNTPTVLLQTDHHRSLPPRA